MGTVGTTQVATAEVSDRSKRFGKPLSQSIFVSRCHKTTVNPRYAIFVVENVASGADQAFAESPGNPAFWLPSDLGATRPRAAIRKLAQWLERYLAGRCAAWRRPARNELWTAWAEHRSPRSASIAALSPSSCARAALSPSSLCESCALAWTVGEGAGMYAAAFKSSARCPRNLAHENLLSSGPGALASWSARTSSATAISAPAAARSTRRC